MDDPSSDNEGSGLQIPEGKRASVSSSGSTSHPLEDAEAETHNGNVVANVPAVTIVNAAGETVDGNGSSTRLPSPGAILRALSLGGNTGAGAGNVSANGSDVDLERGHPVGGA